MKGIKYNDNYKDLHLLVDLKKALIVNMEEVTCIVPVLREKLQDKLAELPKDFKPTTITPSISLSQTVRLSVCQRLRLYFGLAILKYLKK